tara:strand:- start:2883 stop:4226 length:1344 start_codon:yes stop_codon:yes gene_type:complete
MKLHWKILIGIGLGLLYTLFISSASDTFLDLNTNKKFDISEPFVDTNNNGVFDSDYIDFTKNWIAPFGKIFLNLIKLFAIPLIIVSLIKGISSLSDISKLSKMGFKTIGIYITTTFISVSIGLILVNSFNPGDGIQYNYNVNLVNQVESKETSVKEAKERGPLQPIIDIVPDNIFKSATSNKNMLQIVFVSILLGIGLLGIPKDRSRSIIGAIDILNELLFNVIGYIMRFAPIGAFALLASNLVEFITTSGGQLSSLISSIGGYFALVVVGLLIHTLIVYPSILKFIAKYPIRQFFNGISKAQLLAFSTSSSGATLPITMDCCEKNLGVKKEVSSFVLPIGATVNMDGTALYQSVAAVFIAQATGIPLDFYDQISIIIMTVIASIGTAAVPSAGIVMLIIILDTIGIGGAGVALIIGVDRILDMLRTTTNVTGDAAVAVTINHLEKS